MTFLRSGRSCALAFASLVGSLWAQEPTPASPQFAHGGDAFVQVVFHSTSRWERRRDDASGEVYTSELEHEWEVAGLLEVKTQALGDGLLVFTVVGVHGELQGYASEAQRWKREGLAGEGGVMELTERALEGWTAIGVRTTRFPGVGTIEVDLDQRTWTAPELADAFDAWPPLLQADEVYAAEWHPDPTDESVHPVFSYDKQDRLTGMLGDGPDRPSKRSAQTLGLRQKLERSNPLTAMVKPKGAADPLSGTASIEILDGDNRVTASVVWALRRDLPELELHVDAPGFAAWRPAGDRLPLVEGRLPGPALRLTAELVDPTGAPVVGVRIRRLRWWLEDTSRLPGVCSNWPYGSTDTSFDLEFDSERATDEKQRLEFTELTTLRKSVRIVPYDYGAWSTLRVEAELDDGRLVKGRRPGQSGDPTAIRLPDRAPDSRIHTLSKRLLRGDGKADDADDEAEPDGNGKGDGLTLFEEYRGFYVDGRYDFGDGEQKDVFVYDQVGNRDTRAAIARFAAAVGLAGSLHVLHPGHGEMDDSRVLNRNRNGGPSRGPQHVVALRAPPPGAYGGATGDQPKKGLVLVSAPERFYALAPRLRGRNDLYVRGITQAMLMVCGVRQPGMLDPGTMQFTASREPDGSVVVRSAGGKSWVARDERGREDLGAEWLRAAERDGAVLRRRLRGVAGAEAAIAAATRAAATRTLYVARRGGEHSGPLANVMRDTFADAYLEPEARTLFVLPTGADQAVGWILPTTSVGDGFNAADHQPRPRFGDSKRAPARTEFRVNDNGP
ncbi:MAG: hypothetical protein JNL12_07535 [Planctomycetes bacterium]|nr:hypothetical protein [Planctomycetota bacterium]